MFDQDNIKLAKERAEEQDLERKDFIRSFVLQVMLGVEGSYSREYLEAVVSDAAYTWDLIERNIG